MSSASGVGGWVSSERCRVSDICCAACRGRAVRLEVLDPVQRLTAQGREDVEQGDLLRREGPLVHPGHVQGADESFTRVQRQGGPGGAAADE